MFLGGLKKQGMTGDTILYGEIYVKLPSVWMASYAQLGIKQKNEGALELYLSTRKTDYIGSVSFFVKKIISQRVKKVEEERLE